MKNLSLLVLMLVPISLFSQVEWGKYTPKKKRFIKKYYTLSKWIERKDKVPSEVTLSIAALESGWDTDTVAVARNNPLGLNIPGSTELIRFSCLEDCFRYYGTLLSSSKRYSLLESTKEGDYKNYCRILQASGYNSNEGYADYLISMIEYNQFHKIP